jgi:hypothetical protein
VAKQGLRLVNREPGAQARALLDRERGGCAWTRHELPGYDTRASGHLQVAAAIVGGLADAGCQRAGRAGVRPGLHPAGAGALRPAAAGQARRVPRGPGLLKVLTSPWLLAQLASLPGYDARLVRRARLRSVWP